MKEVRFDFGFPKNNKIKVILHVYYILDIIFLIWISKILPLWLTVFSSYWFMSCQGPAPVDPGISKRGQSRCLRKDYSIRKERLVKNSVVGKFRGRKRLIFLGLHRKPIKLWDKEFALFTEATGALPVSRGSEDTERLPVQVLETRADKWMQGASMLQGISLKKRGRGERENDWHGETKLRQWARPNNFIFKRTFIPFPQMMLCTLSSGLGGLWTF